MPVVQPLPPTVPTLPPGPPSPPPLHHNPPGLSRPTTVPTGAPQSQPVTAPLAIPVAVFLLVQETGKNKVCPLGERVLAYKFPPRKSDEKRRRQRACTSGKANRKRDGFKKRKIGRFWILKSAGVGVVPLEPIVRVKTRQTARAAMYFTDGQKTNVIIEAEIDKPRTPFEKFLQRMQADACFYQVYAKEPKYKCTCPDGSKCRGTTRK